jgi:hypothetical protein
MKAIVETYDRHLKQLAAVPPAQRLRVTQGVMLPWLLATIAAFLLVSALALRPSLGVWIIVPTAGATVAGAIYAGSRVSHHGWQYDRTPTDPILREMQGSDVLIRALQRVTLNGLSNLSPATRLQTDLKLTPADMSQLLSILSAENRPEGQNFEDMKSGDMTVGALLQKMFPS